MCAEHVQQLEGESSFHSLVEVKSRWAATNAEDRTKT
jgi:hypothetical protein